jgi:hypothetical protein
MDVDGLGGGGTLGFSSVVFFGRHHQYVDAYTFYLPEMERYDESVLHVEAGDVAITGPGIYTGPFTFSLKICALPVDINRGPCQLRFGFSGSGEYKMDVTVWDAPLLGINRITYSLSDDLRLDYLDMVPEPSSVVLVLSGAALIVLRSRRSILSWANIRRNARRL